MKINIFVKSPRGNKHFLLKAHEAHSADQLKLPLSFYGEGQTVLIFPHWEIEIKEPLVARGETGKLNYHYSDRDGRPYVCFPNSIPDVSKIVEVLSVWSVGQVCVLELDRYLNEMIAEAGNPQAFVFWAKTRQGIELSRIAFS